MVVPWFRFDLQIRQSKPDRILRFKVTREGLFQMLPEKRFLPFSAWEVIDKGADKIGINIEGFSLGWKIFI